MIGPFASAKAQDYHPLAIDPSATEVRFFAAAGSGSIKYRAVYPQGWERAIEVAFRFSRPQPLACFNYADFQYDLRNSSGKRFYTVPDLSKTGEVFPLPNISPHDCVNGVAYLRSTGRARFSLDILYGGLQPGDYTITITFAPKNHSIPAITLPTISFRLAAV
jgi:hypothetical protein